jgi:hypothetical protein
LLVSFGVRLSTMNYRQLRNLKLPPQILVWILGFVAVATIGGSLTMDLSGVSPADQYVVARWGFEGLRVYLWLEGAVLAAIVTALGAHVIGTGLAFARGGQSRLFGLALRSHPAMPRQLGYIFVFLGASLVALSLTTLVLLNSCRYMRIV